jgi:hypothetical protein
VRRTAKGASLIEAELDAKPITSLRDLADAYASALRKVDRNQPSAIRKQIGFVLSFEDQITARCAVRRV